MTRLHATLAAALMTMAIAASVAPAQAQTGDETEIRLAIDGIFEAFETYPLVGLGDTHGIAQEMDFYAALVRDPRFAREVGNVVVEFGAGGRQDVVDRYLAGETVPYTELRTIWTDTVGWIPPAGYLGFAEFLAAMRKINTELPPEDRIRVWLGEPPMDWPSVTPPEFMSAMAARASHPANIIIREILARDRKALVIYGGFHFGGPQTLRARVEAAHPGAFFIVLPYSDIHRPAACAPLLERVAQIWPAPALAVPARPGAPDPAMRECATLNLAAAGVISSGGPPPGIQGDAVLFLGPPQTLTRGPYLPDYALDTELRREMSRRSQAGGPPLIRFPAGLSLRKADYESADLDAPGFAERIDAMFAEYDKNGDGAVTGDEYTDPVP